MLSFHNDPKIKEKYLSRVKLHRKLDNIIQGVGWANGKGCAIGCTLENYDHSRYPIELGLPEWLAKLEDRIFEAFPREEAMMWPEKFLTAIPTGIDVEPVKFKLIIKRMDRLLLIQQNLLEKYRKDSLSEIFLNVISSINLIKSCAELELNKTYCDWSATESAAWSAARSAESAAESAWSAVRSAETAAESAESAAWSAESAADSAADSVRSAAWSAEFASNSAAESAAWSAWSAWWRQESNDLLELLAECK